MILKRTHNFLVMLMMLLVSTTIIGQTFPGGETLRFRLAEDPETLYNVNSISITVSNVLNYYLLDKLVYFGPDGKPKPWLAESWEVSKDEKEITFNLRQGVKFHDGTDFNASAVKFHFDTILDPKNASPQLPNLGPLQQVEVVNDYKVKFRFEKPFAAFFINLTDMAGGFNSPTAVKKLGKNYDRNPVTTGPYMFESWIPGSEITLIRNPNYRQFRKDAVNKGLPHAKKVILIVIAEDGTALAALEAGELTSSGLQSDIIDRFVGDDNFNVVLDKIATNLVFLEFNYQRAPFDDPKFRHALGYSIDRSAAVKAAWSGYASTALSPLAVGIPGFDEQVASKFGTPYNPEKATRLLEELGWKDTDGDGILDKDGKPAKFLAKSYAGFTHIERTLAVIQSNLKDIGIIIDLETADWGAFYPSLLENDWDMDLMRWSNDDAVVLSQLFRSPGHRKKLMNNSKIDDVLDRCDSTMNPELRAQCLSKAQQVLMEESIIVPILTNWSVIATQGNVKDYTLDYLGFLISGDVRIEN